MENMSQAQEQRSSYDTIPVLQFDSVPWIFPGKYELGQIMCACVCLCVCMHMHVPMCAVMCIKISHTIEYKINM